MESWHEYDIESASCSPANSDSVLNMSFYDGQVSEASEAFSSPKTISKKLFLSVTNFFLKLFRNEPSHIHMYIAIVLGLTM